MNATRIAIHGAGGRMGQRLVALGIADPQLDVVAALEYAEHPRLGEDAGLIAGAGETGVLLSNELTCEVDAVIDFSIPVASEKITQTCLAGKIPLVVATTGFDESQIGQIHEAAKTIPLLFAPSMSLAVNLLMKLTDLAGRAMKEMPSGVDVEIIERHHRFKEDAPSGTALRFGQIVAGAMGQTTHQHGRSGRPGQRPHNEIGYHALRTGDNPGEHTIVFGMLGETIELTVRASNRDCYAHGALTAAKFIAEQKPGLYNMNDVLGL